MLNYKMDIETNSKWVVSTPNELAVSLPFKCSEVGDFYAKENFYTERDYKNSYWLVYTLKGEGVLEQNNVIYNLSKGSLMLIDCKTYQSYKTAQKCKLWHHYWIHIDGEGVSAMYPIINVGQPVNLSANSYEIEAQFATIIENASQNNLAESLNVSMAIHSLLNAMCLPKLASVGTENRRQNDIIKIADYIREHYREPLQIEELAKMVHVSKYYFIRLFRQYLGTTPYDYLLHFRITKAKQFLCSTQWSIGSIGLFVGFSSESNFTAQFTRIVSVSPAKYRKEHYAID